MSSIVGIDPGLQGGIAIMNEKGRITSYRPMPKFRFKENKERVDAQLAYEWIAYDWVGRNSSIELIVIEKVGAMPKQGVTSMFSFGVSYGIVLAIADILDVSLEQPTPQQWKKVVLGGTDKSKSAAINYVKNRFPKVNLLATERSRKPHDGIADAICLAEYGRRLLVGK